TSLATVKLSPADGKEAELTTALVAALRELALKPGLTGAHLLITDTPRMSAPTTEQQMRGSDAAADWIILLSGYDPDVVQNGVAHRLSSTALNLLGAQKTSI